MLKRFLTALCFLLCASSAGAATIRYVKASCVNATAAYEPIGDTCTGGSATVYSSINNAFAAGLIVAGDTLDIRAGTYSEDIIMSNFSFAAGTASAPITIQGHAGEAVTFGRLNAGYIPSLSYWVFDNVTMNGTLTGANTGQNTFYTGLMTNVTIKNSIIKNGPLMGVQGAGTFNLFQRVTVFDSGRDGVPHYDYGVYYSGSDTIFEYMDVYNSPGYGYHIFDTGSNSVARNIVRYSKIHNNGGSEPSNAGIIISTGPSNRVYGNIIYNNNRGVQVNYRCHGCMVYNNSIYGNAIGAGVVVGEEDPSISGVVVKNNIIWGNPTNGIVDNGTGTVKSNNYCDSMPGGGGAGCSQSGANPFTNAAGGDFTLVPGSGAIDGGVSSIATGVTALANGSLPDIGAFEAITFASASATTTSVLDVTFGAAYAPLSTVASCANVTVRQAGATKTCLSFVNNGNATYRWTCTTACLSSGGGTIDIQIAAGKFTDSIAIGGALNQSNFALPVTAVANNISGATEVFATMGVRQRTYAQPVTATTGSAWIKAENAIGTVRVDSGKFSGWWLIGCTAANCPSVGFQFEQNLNAGAFANTTDSCITNPLCFDSTNSAAPHGTVIADCMLTNIHGNCLAGAVAAQASSYPVLDLAQNQAAPIQGNFAIKSGLSVGDRICIRPKLDSGAAITHNETLCIDVVNPAGSPA